MLRKAVKEYEIYYNTERPHQGLENDLINPEDNTYRDYLTWSKSNGNLKISDLESGKIVKNERLGGLLKSYYRKTG